MVFSVGKAMGKSTYKPWKTMENHGASQSKMDENWWYHVVAPF